jgi:hypothetical protein
MRRAAALLVLFAGLAVLHTWPLAGDLSGLSRLDNDDAGLNVFVVAWVSHSIPRDPLALFDAPIFFPEPHTLAYSEHLIVPSLMGAPLLWAGLSPVTVYNVLVLAGFTFSGWAMALVVRRWTGSTTGGVMAGMLYAFNAHLLTRLVHLQALHLEFLPPALLALDHILRAAPYTSPAPSGATARSVSALAAAAASAFVLQALCSNYTLVFLGVALLVAALARGDEWLWPVRTHRLRALALAAIVSAAALAPFLWPYYLVHRDQGLTRPLEEVALYSAGWADYLATGGRLHYAAWSHRWFEGRTPLFPGVVALALAAAALAVRQTRQDPRVRMMAAVGLVGLALSFGPALPGYAWLHAHVPLFEGLRAAARWGLLPLTAVAVLAGFAVAGLEQRYGRLTYWTAASLLLLALPTIEALRAPMAFAGVPVIPALYDDLAQEPDAVLVELPLYGGPSVSENAQYLLHSTRHFRPLINGYSGFEPEASRRRAERWRDFPDRPVLEEMAALGVTHIVVHTGRLSPAQVQATAGNDRLQLLRSDESRRLYTLRP